MQRQFSSCMSIGRTDLNENGRKRGYYELTRHSNMPKVSSPCKFVQRREFSFYFKFKNKQQQANKQMRNMDVTVIVHRHMHFHNE
jgi:hypothetical protein